MSTTNYASFGRRFVAVIIDSIVVYVVQTFVFVPILGIVGINLAPQIQNVGYMSQEEAAGMFGQIMAAAGALYLVSFLIVLLYYSFMESSKYQATVGKMAMGIKVTDVNGAKISFGKAILRTIGKYISGMILLIGYIMAAFTEKKQALHDMIASTLVVKK